MLCNCCDWVNVAELSELETVSLLVLMLFWILVFDGQKGIRSGCPSTTDVINLGCSKDLHLSGAFAGEDLPLTRY